jgi:hypothetical protein
MALNEGAEIELTLRMPSEITLGENMRVRCRGQVLRRSDPADKKRWFSEGDHKEDGMKPAAMNSVVTEPAGNEAGQIRSAETKIGVAVCLKEYEYLPAEEDSSAEFRRISALHSPVEDDRRAEPVHPRPLVH